MVICQINITSLSVGGINTQKMRVVVQQMCITVYIRGTVVYRCDVSGRSYKNKTTVSLSVTLDEAQEFLA